jgi:hypothetical protein
MVHEVKREYLLRAVAVACLCVVVGTAVVGTATGIAGGSAATTSQRERPLSGDVAAKVRAAALAKVDSGTTPRVETDADHGSPYEAHVRKADGTVTAVNQMQHP